MSSLSLFEISDIFLYRISNHPLKYSQSLKCFVRLEYISWFTLHTEDNFYAFEPISKIFLDTIDNARLFVPIDYI